MGIIKRRLWRGLSAALLAAALLLLLAVPALAGDDDRLLTLVNKEHTLSSDYEPDTLVRLSGFMSGNSGVSMCATAAEALEELVNAARADGIKDIYAISGYRSYGVQSGLYTRKVTYYRNLGYGVEDARSYAATVVAPPGASEHQTGLALDFGTAENGYALTDSFADTALGRWLDTYSWRYGFILRYPENKTDITGYIYEPWHFRYVGQPHAEYMYKNDLTLEEYYQLLCDSGSLDFTTWDGTVYEISYSSYYPQQLEPNSKVSVAAAVSGGYITTTRVGKVNFADLLGHWSEREVCALIRLGVINGYSDDTFRPNKMITRGEVITLVAEVEKLLFDAGGEYSGLSAEDFAGLFADVYADSWFLPQLWINYENNLIDHLLTEDSQGRYVLSPSRPALRAEVAQSLALLCAELDQDENIDLQMTDLDDADEALREAVQTLVACGVVQGRPGGKFDPYATITRAEVSTMLYRLICGYEKAGYAIAVPAAEADSPAAE